MRLNQVGEPAWLAIETSGHAAMQENYFLDDGAYLLSKLLIELARARLAGRQLTNLIATLQEPQESQEFRLKIQVSDFKTLGLEVIDQLQAFIASQPDWQVVPKNYEGLRVACQSPQEKGWFLLRLSLHDPVLPLNIESNVVGGVARIAQRLGAFFQPLTTLDSSALEIH